MTTLIGIPAERKERERRVVLDPPAVRMLTDAGAAVRVEIDAGIGAGFSNADYEQAGAEMCADRAEIWAADVVCKVKEPIPDEWPLFRPGLRIFAFLHLAANRELAEALVQSRVEAFAFETTTDPRGGLPLLAPMSEIAGRVAPIVGSLHLAHGSGTLVGGAAGVPPGRVVVIGMGVAGTLAARGARGLDGHVTGIDVNLERLYDARLRGALDSSLVSSRAAVAAAVADADLVIGAALVVGARTPVVVSREMVAGMRPGSVIVDLSIDQGGCIETARPTTLSNPTYVENEVIHYCVTNVPGQYPRTASRALAAAVAPRLRALALDAEEFLLANALNVADGELVHPEVAYALAGAHTAAH